MLVCVKCGEKFENVESVAKFCPYCGSILQSEEAAKNAQPIPDNGNEIFKFGKAGIIVLGVVGIIAATAMALSIAVLNVNGDFDFLSDTDGNVSAANYGLLISIFGFLASGALSMTAFSKAKEKAKLVGRLERRENAGKIMGLIGFIVSAVWIFNSAISCLMMIPVNGLW